MAPQIYSFTTSETQSIETWAHSRFGPTVVRVMTAEAGLHYDDRLDQQQRASFYKTSEGFELWTNFETREPQKTAPDLDALLTAI